MKSVLKVALLLTASLVVAGLLAEAAVLLVLGEQVKFPRHVVGAPWGLRYNEPNAEYRHKSPDVTVWFRINAQGMRAARDFAVPKPEDRKRIVSLGDSFTVGYEVAAEETFSSVLEQTLRDAGHRVEVLNAGVSGFSTAEQYLYLERELWRYEADVVLVSFYVNDLVDNVRTGLFGLDEKGRLVERRSSYVPAGGLGDFLNRSALFNWLSGYSNAFAYAKEAATKLLKRRMVAENLESLDRRPSNRAATRADSKADYRERLGMAIFEALYRSTRKRGVPLVIQSIPHLAGEDGLVDAFPAGFDLARPGIHFLSMKELLDPHLGSELLYWTRSHWHWTPFSHRLSGQALAELIRTNDLLGG